jgi:hypothetical protein
MSNVDLDLNVDHMTDELLNILLEQYKEENDIDLNATHEQPDEEDFKDKFPWTLDKKPEPAKSPAKPLQAGKRVKTEREVKDEKFLEKHNRDMEKLDDIQDKAEKFLEFMCKRVDLKKLAEQLMIPIDSMDSMILPQSYFNRIDREFVITERML